MYTMVMGYHRIYIAKAVADKFKTETNKSGLINDLLSSHYTVAKLPAVAQSKPTITTPKAKICKEHGIDEKFCKEMKHKR